MKTYRVLCLVIAMALVLSACNLPSSQPTPQPNPNAVFTAAAETVVAQLTQSALLNPTSAPPTVAPPTDTPPAPAAPTNTPGLSLPLATATSQPVVVVPTVGCDAAQFITDVTVPDGTVYSANATFTKTWRLKNIGTCTWNTSYALIFDSGSNMGGAASIPLASSVAPGGSIDLSVNLQAPSADGAYTGFWGIKNASGVYIPVAGGFSNKLFSVVIKVGSGGTSGDSTGGKFGVTSVNFGVTHTGACSFAKYTITATITTNQAGDVTYVWKRSDGATGPGDSGTLTFDSATSQSITFEWSNGGGVSVSLYIDKPNHQTFGPANLNCP